MTRWDWLGTLALVALAVLQIVWHGYVHYDVDPFAITLLTAAPLWAAIWIVFKNPRRGLLVGGIVGLFYFCHGVMEAWAVPTVRTFALLEAGLVVVLIGALGAATMGEKRKARLPRK